MLSFVAIAMTLNCISEYDKVTPKAKKNQGEKATEFRCVSFDEWLLLFVEVFIFVLLSIVLQLDVQTDSQYAFLLTQRDQYPLADEILRHAAQSVVFQEPEPADTLRIALIGKRTSLIETFQLTIPQHVPPMQRNMTLSWPRLGS